MRLALLVLWQSALPIALRVELCDPLRKLTSCLLLRFSHCVSILYFTNFDKLASSGIRIFFCPGIFIYSLKLYIEEKKVVFRKIVMH